MGEMDQLEAVSYLPTDVQLMVLDYVNLYPDLLALCLTSGSWNLVATKVLYRNIVLDIRTRNGQLSLFRQCLEVGASRHLQYAQKLSLLDVPIFECNRILRNKAPWIHGERDTLLLQILQSFPSNKLTTFRYLSQIDLKPSIINLLQKQQQSIVDFELSHGNFQQLVTPMTRRVTAGVSGDAQQTFGLVELAQKLPRLEKFALLLKNVNVFLLEDYWSRCSYSTFFPNKQIVSRELMFDGYLPGGFVSAIPHMFNLSHLTRLFLYTDNFWYWKPLFSSQELRNLTHFDFHSPDSFDHEKSMDLEDLFTRNQNLRHLNLHMRLLKTVSLEPLLADDGSTLASYISPLCPRLKSLSLFDLWSVEKRASYFPSMASLDAICDELGALEQFGLRVAEIGGCLLANGHDRQKYVLGRLCKKPIGKLKNLKMLHLYQDRIRIIDPDQPRNVAAETQQLAAVLFQWAHDLCPDLEVLIWGRFTETLDNDVYSLLEDELETEGSLANNVNVERVPQQYYVKQVTRVRGGAPNITAIPFSRRRIQNEFPDLDLLACDTSVGTLDRMARDIVY